MATSVTPLSLPVMLTTHTPYPLPTQKFMIPSTWRRYQLSQLVNKALALLKPIPFDFLVSGEILRTSLGEWCREHGKGEEETVEIEYIESVLPPEKVSEIPHEEWVSSVSCAVPGFLLTASYDGHLRAFPHSNPAVPTATHQAHTAPITSVCIVDPHTATLATASHDLTASLTRLALSPDADTTSTTLVTLHLHTGPVSHVSASPSGSHLLTSSWDGLIGLWDTTIPREDEIDLPVPNERDRKKRRRVTEGTAPKRKAPLTVLKSHIGRVSAAVFEGDNKAYSCGFDSTVRAWDTENGICVHTITSSEKPFLSLSLAPSSPSHVLATSTDRTLTLYDVRLPSTSLAPVSFAHPSTPSCVASLDTSSSSQQVVTGAYDSLVRLWDLRSPKGAIASFKAWERSGKVLGVDWAQTGDGKGLVGVGGEGGLGIWRIGV